MFLAGLWCSTFNPAAFSFLEPIFKRLKTLEKEGTYVDFIYYKQGGEQSEPPACSYLIVIIGNV